MKIVRTDCELRTPKLDAALVSAGHDLVLLPDGVSEEDLLDATHDADLILMCYTPITRRVIENAPRLKGIVKYGVGIDAIDIPAAIDAGVAVVNVPEYAEETVAEGAFALLIALAKKLTALNTHMTAEGWAWPEPTWMGSDIAGKTVGIIGLGKIGRSMARMAGLGFRANVIAYSPHTSAEEMAALGVTKVEHLHDLMAQSDFVTIHAVLNNDTRGMIGEAELQAMKPSAFLINVSRGAIVDEAALVRAICEGWIAGAGLDVFSQEPLTRTGHRMSALYDHPNVILSPHLTFYTEEAMQRLEDEALERCFEVLEGRNVLVKSHDPRLRAQVKGVAFTV
ncbi:C-terminal binding protein [Aliiroseovarius sp. S2029]|uniref:C-terminal binding protein n=1 Tax=Aliiroseovarius sp. S2029 TaxID=2936988 RepID=UPI0020BF695A|nr:C-terminal binding protein [Aliiroseovarius sp. S2029]MCK8484233.1 C-terminal binding protein [Aliiroseovarius sp. S2029]